MKITSKADPPAILSSKSLNPFPDSVILQKPKHQRPSRRKSGNPGRSSAGVRLRRDGSGPAGRRSRPETPLLRWKFDEGEKEVPLTEERLFPPECGRRSGGKAREREKEAAVSARKLAAVLWQLRLPEAPAGGGQGADPTGLTKSSQLGFQYEGDHMPVPFVGHNKGIMYHSKPKDLMQSSWLVPSPRNGHLCKFAPSFQLSISALEGATKWNPIWSNMAEDVQQIYGHTRHIDKNFSVISAVSALKVELEQAQARIHELEVEKKSSKKKLEHFLRKLSEERAAWRSKEHEKIRAVIDDIKADLNRERKNRQRLEIVNSKLVSELADAKLLAKRHMQDYEKEQKARVLIEEVCDELANEIEKDKAEAESLKRESMKLREEVEEERKMLQIAEVWREERVQMKLVDAKVAIEGKYSHMNKLIAALEAFLSSSVTLNAEEMKKAEFLCQAAASVNIQEIMEFTYERPKSDDIFAVLEDVNLGEANEREIEPSAGHSPTSHASEVHAVSPDVRVCKKGGMRRHTDTYLDQDGDIEEDESEWETVSHVEDQGSSYSPAGSDRSVNMVHRDSNFSGGGMECGDNACEVTLATEIGEACMAPKSHVKKVSSISRLWRSCPNNGENFKIISVEGVDGRLSNGRFANGATISPDRGSGKGRHSPELLGQWSSPEQGNPHITRGIKGCIEWPLGMQKSSLKSKLLEARMESQKIQLRQVLKQKI